MTSFWNRRVRKVYVVSPTDPVAPSTPTLALTVAPAGGTDAAAFATQPVMTLSSGAQGVTVTAALATGSGSLIGGTTAVTNSSGVATFTTLGVDVPSPPSSVTIQFTAAGATPVTTGSLTIAAQAAGSGTWPNEPIGGGWQRVVDWTPTVAPGISAPSSEGLRDYAPGADPTRVWYGGDGSIALGDIITDGTSPVSPQVYRIKFPQNFWGGTGNQDPVRVFGTPFSWSRTISTGHMYVGCYFRLSSGFTSNGNVSLKILYLLADNPNLAPGVAWSVSNPAISTMCQSINAEGTSTRPIFTNQYRDYGPDGVAYTGDDDARFFNTPDAYGSLGSAFECYDGDWHRMETLITPNTWTGSTANADGSVSVYFDGSLAGTSSNVVVFGNRTTVPHWNYLAILPVYGGGFNPVPQDQYLYIAGIRGATK
jgi:hypothetical protein